MTRYLFWITRGLYGLRHLVPRAFGAGSKSTRHDDPFGWRSTSRIPDEHLAWDEEIGWHDPLRGEADGHVVWDSDEGRWVDRLAEARADWVSDGIVEPMAVYPPGKWIRHQAHFLLDDFKMWMRRETYRGRQFDLEVRRADRKAQLRAYFNDFTQFLARVFLRRPAA
jgi:hypothetical protein